MTGYGRIQLKENAPAQEIAENLQKVFSDVFVDEYKDLVLNCDGGPLEDEALDALNGIREHVLAGDVYMDCPLEELEDLDRWRYHFTGTGFVCQRADMRWESDEEKKTHPFTAEELENAMRGVIDLVRDAGVIEYMDIPKDMAVFFGCELEEEDFEYESEEED